ncbi:2327_t:CDS:1, partial [Racocetra fulgida]
MPPGHTSGNGPPAMRDDLEKIVYETNPSIRQSMRFSKFDFKDMDHLITVNDGYDKKGDAGGPEIVNKVRYIENDGVKNPISDHSNSSYMSPDPVQHIKNPTNSPSNIEKNCPVIQEENEKYEVYEEVDGEDEEEDEDEEEFMAIA